MVCTNEHCGHITENTGLCEECLSSLAHFFAGEYAYNLHTVAMIPPHQFSQETDGVLPEAQAWDLKLAAMSLCNVETFPGTRKLPIWLECAVAAVSIAGVAFCFWAFSCLAFLGGRP